MKQFFGLVFIFFSLLTQAQMPAVIGASNSNNIVETPPAPSLVTAINYTKNVRQPRVGEPVVFTMDGIVPDGSIYLWEFQNSKATTAIKSTSTIRGPTFTPDSALQRYDINLTVSNANTLFNNQHAYIPVLPAIPVTADYHLDLNALTDTKGTHFTNSATVLAVNGISTLTTSANHGLSVGDHLRIAYGGGFYTAQTGTTGTTIVLDRVYEGPTATVPNAQTLDLGTSGKTYTFDLSTQPGGVTIDLLDKLGNDTGYNVKTYADFKIKITGDLYGYMEFQNIIGTDGHPVHFYNEGLVRFFAENNSLPYCIQAPGFFQNVILDGQADADYEYGIEFHGNRAGGNGQLLFINNKFNTEFYCTGVKVKAVYGNDAAAFSYDMPNNSGTGASSTNAAASGNNIGASTFVVKNVVSTTIPLVGRINVGGSSGQYYNYSNYNAGTKTFTLTSTLSQNYSEDDVVNINICSDYNWYATNVWFWHCIVEPTNGGIGEGFYIMFNNASVQTNGFRPPHAVWVFVFDCIINSSDRDGIQISHSKKAEVTNNRVYQTAKGDFVGHTNAVSWNDGNQGIISRNIFIGHKDAIVAETQVGGDCLISANVWDIDNGVGGAATSTYFFEAVEVGAPANIDYYWTNNTVIGDLNGTGLLFFTMQYSGGTSSKSLLHTVANNVVIKRSATETNYAEMATVSVPSGDRTLWLISNELFTVAQTALPKFVDYANKNYDIADATSPLFNSGVDLTTRLAAWPAWAKLDINGYSFTVNGGQTSGAYSGCNKFITP